MFSITCPGRVTAASSFDGRQPLADSVFGKFGNTVQVKFFHDMASLNKAICPSDTYSQHENKTLNIRAYYTNISSDFLQNSGNPTKLITRTQKRPITVK
jgi:hypothetical protein